MTYTPTTDIALSFIQFNGGLNDTSGPFGVQENESPDLQNINFDKFEVASIAQEIYEEEFKKIIDVIEDDNLVFVGGCALNVSANRFLTKFNTFIPCNPGDGGSAIG